MHRAYLAGVEADPPPRRGHMWPRRSAARC